MTDPSPAERLLAFYADDAPGPSGYTLDAILGWPDADWEEQHDFIQFLFPTDTPSMFNPDAPVLDMLTIAHFRSDPFLRHRLRRSFERWLAFCGIARTADGLAFDRPNPQVWGRQNHNWLRISRVLRSLALLGLVEEAGAFFRLLETVKDRIDPATWAYWEDARPVDTP